MVGTASGEVGRSPWCGAARTKTNNGRGAGRDGKFACGPRRRPRSGGQRRSESAARRLGLPPARAVGSSRTGGTPRPASARPIYSPRAARRRGKAHSGRGLNADRPGSPGNAARRPADVRPLLGLSLVAANFSPSGEGRREEGRASRASRASGGARPLWVLLGGGGGGNISLSSGSWSLALANTFTFYLTGTGLPRTCLSPPDPAGPTGPAFISHPSFCSARGNCKTQQYCNGARCQVAWDWGRGSRPVP